MASVTCASVKVPKVTSRPVSFAITGVSLYAHGRESCQALRVGYLVIGSDLLTVDIVAGVLLVGRVSLLSEMLCEIVRVMRRMLSFLNRDCCRSAVW